MKPYYNEGFDFINSFHPIPEDIYSDFYDSSNLKKLKPNDVLLKLGTTPKKIYFISKGVVRAYKPLVNGKEVSITLFSPFMFFASFKALLDREPTKIVYQALTECEVFEVDFKEFQRVSANNPDVLKAYTKFLEYLVIRSEARFVELSSTNAKERYLSLRKRIPDLDNVLPQYQIAAGLGITPVQLSRIRAKM